MIKRADELGRLSAAFNQMSARIEQTVALLQQFAADAAHELNTPLTALKTNLELLDIEEGPQAIRLQEAREQVGRLERLTADLLDLSRIESKTEKPVRLDLTALVAETAERYAGRAEQKGISFALDLPDGAVFIEGHPWQLRRAAGNLLDNAVKFTPSGGRIAIELDKGQAVEVAAAVLTVRDSGPGIPAEEIPFLFNRFYRGRRTSHQPGSGLGLAIVQAIAHEHGGHVAVEAGDSGTAVSLALPLLPQSASR